MRPWRRCGRTRSRCSPCTRPRAWSGTWSRSPGSVEGVFPTGNGRAQGSGSNGWLSGAFGALPYPLRGDTAACRTGLPRRRAARRTSPGRSRRSRCWPASTRSPRSAGWRTWRRRGPARSWRSPAPSGATDPRRASRAASCRRSPASPRTRAGRRGRARRRLGRPARGRGAEPARRWTGPEPWPVDPLGGARDAVEEAAAMVRAFLAGTAPGLPRTAEADARHTGAASATAASTSTDVDDADGDPVVAGWDEEAALLLAERAAAAEGAVRVELPAHLSASKVVALAADPDGFADRLRRPLPQPPQPAARRGSAFHAWLERRYGARRPGGPRGAAGRRRRRRRGRRPRAAAGAVPGEPVGPARSRRGGGRRRDAGRRGRRPGQDRRRVPLRDARRPALGRRRLEDRVAAARAWPSSGPAPCSSRCTGSRGRACTASRSSTSGRRSSMRRPARRCVRSSSSTSPPWPRCGRPGRDLTGHYPAGSPVTFRPARP